MDSGIGNGGSHDDPIRDCFENLILAAFALWWRVARWQFTASKLARGERIEQDASIAEDLDLSFAQFDFALLGSF